MSNKIIKVRNPESGRLIKINSTIYNRLIRKFDYDAVRNLFVIPEGRVSLQTQYIQNPQNQELVKVNSISFRRLSKKYEYDSIANTFGQARQKQNVQNPENRKMVRVNGSSFKKLENKGYVYDTTNNVFILPEGGELLQKQYVRSPESRRLIEVNGSTFNRLKQKYDYSAAQNVFIAKQQPTFDGEYWQYNETTLTKEVENLIIEKRNTYAGESESKYLKMKFFNNITSLEDIYKYLDKIYQTENNSIKLNISFGYITLKIGDTDPRIITPGSNNYFFSSPLTLKNASDFSKLKKLITKASISEHLTQHFSESQISMLGVYAMAVKITRLNFPIGNKIELPDYIKASRFINGLENVDNKMCFWACMALTRGCRTDRYITKATELFNNFYAGKKTIIGYQGFDYINELDQYEEFDTVYAINIVSYYEDQSISYIRKSKFNVTRIPVYLNLYLNHFSCITNFQKLGKIYLCSRCDMKFKYNRDMLVHFDTCILEQTDVFNKYPELWKKPRNLIVQLADYYDVDVDFKYDYLAIFDLESILKKNYQNAGSKLNYVSRHIPVSNSIVTNVPEFEEVKFILSEDPRELTKQMFEYIDQFAAKARELMIAKMQPLIDCLTERGEQKYLSQVYSYCSAIPIVGFNTGFYDINLLSNEGFMEEILKRDRDAFVIKDGNRYKVIKTTNFIFLDQMNYCAPGTSLDKFIKAYDVGENKFWFPYEWFDSYEKLDYLVTNLEITDFYSSLKNKSMSQKDFLKFRQICKQNNLISVRDLLEYYNNLDVGPLLKACLKQKEFFYTFKLDMYKDGFSLPALSENILYQFQIQGFDKYLLEKPEIPETSLRLSNEKIQKKIEGYKEQDEGRGRPTAENATVEDVRFIIERERYCCYYCWYPLCNYSWSLDRLDCSKPHVKDNCVAACVKCNTARSNKPYKKFYRQKALLRWEKEHPMIWLFGEENKEVFYKFKKNIRGGPSIVFHRYHEKDRTQITRTRYEDEWTYDKEGKLVKKIVGFDANALYLYCLGEEMPCGKLYWKETEDWKTYQEQILQNKFFGFLEVDIQVPEDKWEYFGEMCPLFINKEFSEEVCGQYTNDLLQKLGKKPTKCRRLIATLKAENILLKSTTVKWLIEHGCIVTKLYGVIEAKRRRIFKGFMEWVTNERRKGDVDIKYAIIADAAKIVGNSAFGRTAMDKNKHKKVKFCNEVQFNRAKNSYFYYDAEEYNGAYIVYKRPKKVKQNMPIQIAWSVFDDAKLRMNQFYYDCIDKYLDRSDFQYIEMDTDSAYMALTGDFESIIKPELIEEFNREKHKWFPQTKFDKRTPGLFKIEYEGDGMVALCSKTYYVWGDKNKVSSKGLQHNRNTEVLTKEKYLECLLDGKTIEGKNNGFRFVQKEMKTYEQNKIGLSPIYTKAVVMDDGVHIRPIKF